MKIKLQISKDVDRTATEQGQKRQFSVLLKEDKKYTNNKSRIRKTKQLQKKLEKITTKDSKSLNKDVLNIIAGLL